MKKVLLSGLLLSVFSGASQAALGQAELNKLQREVGIMENILSTALKQDTDKRVRNIESRYLMSQGVVFELKMPSGGSRLWSDIFASGPDAPVEPMQVIAIDDVDVEFITEEVMATSHEAYRAAMDLIRESAERVRDIAEKERDVARDIRELEREKRDLDMERRFQQDEDAKELVERKKQLESEISKLQKQKDELDKQQAKLKREIKRDKAERNELQNQQREKLLGDVTTSIARSLCDYGAGLRTLPENEHISVILQGAVDKKTSQVYVFDKKQVMQCVTGRLKAKKLLSDAQVYQF